jgi:hypothetical protein
MPTTATGSMTDDELAKLLRALDAAFPHRSHFLVVPSGGLNVVASPPICPDPVPQFPLSGVKRT